MSVRNVTGDQRGKLDKYAAANQSHVPDGFNLPAHAAANQLTPQINSNTPEYDGDFLRLHSKDQRGKGKSPSLVQYGSDQQGLIAQSPVSSFARYLFCFVLRADSFLMLQIMDENNSCMNKILEDPLERMDSTEKTKNTRYATEGTVKIKGKKQVQEMKKQYQAESKKGGKQKKGWFSRGSGKDNASKKSKAHGGKDSETQPIPMDEDTRRKLEEASMVSPGSQEYFEIHSQQKKKMFGGSIFSRKTSKMSQSPEHNVNISPTPTAFQSKKSLPQNSQNARRNDKQLREIRDITHEIDKIGQSTKRSNASPGKTEDGSDEYDLSANEDQDVVVDTNQQIELSGMNSYRDRLNQQRKGGVVSQVVDTEMSQDINMSLREGGENAIVGGLSK